MTRLEFLQKASSKKEFSELLGLNASFLTRTLYIRKTESQYSQFKIPKRSGGDRIINSPTDELKDIQSRLSTLLLDCIDEINKSKNIVPKLSHGFTRNRSIITNAEKHIKQKNVLNIDLSDFFDSFNFGRIRGFFIKNKNFLLHEDIATVIAKISCLNNSLPQGSPCSPVITNLITHSLDIRLASFARKSSCIYSRYADDITFSTRNRSFVSDLVKVERGCVSIGNKLRREIERSGFKINENKSRVQFNDSRQDVTGLVVNEKVSIKREYWKTTKSMCHKLFTTGSYTHITPNGEAEGSLHELGGRLNFIDSIDRYNRFRLSTLPDHRYQLNKNNDLDYRVRLNSREKVFSKFLYYQNFVSNDSPTILCEGKTDNVYLKSAINVLSSKYPLLAREKSDKEPYELLVNFFKYSKRTKFLLDLHGGGSYLKYFIQRYIKNLTYYKKGLPRNPVILVLDNDTGPNELVNYLAGKTDIFTRIPKDKDVLRGTEFIPIISNLYLVLTPRSNGNETMMEDFFDQAALSTLVDGRSFDPKKDADTTVTYGKNTFSIKVVKENRSSIRFEGFKPILDRISNVISYHKDLVDNA